MDTPTTELQPINKTLQLILDAYEPCQEWADADVRQNTTELWQSIQKQRPDVEVDTDQLFDFMLEHNFKQVNFDGNWCWLLALKNNG